MRTIRRTRLDVVELPSDTSEAWVLLLSSIGDCIESVVNGRLARRPNRAAGPLTGEFSILKMLLACLRGQLTALTGLLQQAGDESKKRMLELLGIVFCQTFRVSMSMPALQCLVDCFVSVLHEDNPSDLRAAGKKHLADLWELYALTSELARLRTASLPRLVDWAVEASCGSPSLQQTDLRLRGLLLSNDWIFNDAEDGLVQERTMLWCRMIREAADEKKVIDRLQSESLGLC